MKIGLFSFLKVHGFGDRAGQFSILVEQHDIQTSNRCGTAIDIVADGTTILGRTDFGVEDGFLDNSMIEPPANCMIGSGDVNENVDDFILGPGFFYNVTGTGQPLTASSCGRTLSFDGEVYEPKSILVLSGTCDRLECTNDVQYTSCGSNSTRASVTWMSELDVSYILFVYDVKLPTP